MKKDIKKLIGILDKWFEENGDIYERCEEDDGTIWIGNDGGVDLKDLAEYIIKEQEK